MGASNDYPCSFINVFQPAGLPLPSGWLPNITNTSFVVLSSDPSRRPTPDTPECCIIGRPFHPPPMDFARRMPMSWSQDVFGQPVDWFAIEDRSAGIFAYGFDGSPSPSA